MLGCGGGRSGTGVPEPDGEILLLGCEGAGKTLLCRQLERLCSGSGTADECNTSTVPSIGTELLTLRRGKRAAAVREVGGAMRAVWARRPAFFRWSAPIARRRRLARRRDGGVTCTQGRS